MRRKQGKRIHSILLCMALLVCSFMTVSGTVSAGTETKTQGHWTYIVLDESANTVAIESYTGSDTEIEIPGKLGLYTVTGIDHGAFYNCTNLTSITIPDSVISIGDYAFKGCTSLKSINIPDSVTSIGVDAFDGCTSLTTITVDLNSSTYQSYDGVLYSKDGKRLIRCGEGRNSIEFLSSVTSIDDGAFYCCASLNNIMLGNNVASIGGDAFLGCTSLESISIPNSMTSIGGGAFSGCTSLKSINIPDNVTSIGRVAFNDCTSLKSINISDSVTSIGDWAFSGCTGLSSIELGSGMTSIEGNTFHGCTSLESISIPNSMTSIDFGAFCGCTGLKSIEIPYSVTSIGRDVFSNCTSLTTITVDSNSSTYQSYDGVLYSKDGKKLIRCGEGRNSIAFLSDVTSIGECAFYDCTNLTSIEIPDSVTSIDDSAFDSCSRLESITIPNSVISIGAHAFHGCTSLKSINIPDSVTSISNDIFYDCINLSSIEIPDSVTSIDDGTFDSCTSLTTITVDSNSSTYQSYDGVLYSKDGKKLIRCGKGRNSIAFLSGVTSIGSGAFYDCTNLTSIEIPNSVTNIDLFAFEDCTNLTSIEIPVSVTSINDSAFSGCSKNITIIGTSGSYAETYAKQHNINFQPIVDTTTEVETAGTTNVGQPSTNPNFVNTSAVDTSLASTFPVAKKGTVLNDTEADCKVKVVSSDTKQPSVTYTGTSNPKAASVKVPDAVTIDGVTYKVVSIAAKAFKGNKKLKKLTIDKNVTTIGSSAFENCTNLTSITINAPSLSKIGANAFKGDKKLTKITLKTTKLTKNSVAKNALKGTNKKLVIQVPKKNVSAYKKYFKNKGNKTVQIKK